MPSWAEGSHHWSGCRRVSLCKENSCHRYRLSSAQPFLVFSYVFRLIINSYNSDMWQKQAPIRPYITGEAVNIMLISLWFSHVWVPWTTVLAYSQQQDMTKKKQKQFLGNCDVMNCNDDRNCAVTINIALNWQSQRWSNKLNHYRTWHWYRSSPGTLRWFWLTWSCGVLYEVLIWIGIFYLMWYIWNRS